MPWIYFSWWSLGKTEVEFFSFYLRKNFTIVMDKIGFIISKLFLFILSKIQRESRSDELHSALLSFTEIGRHVT